MQRWNKENLLYKMIGLSLLVLTSQACSLIRASPAKKTLFLTHPEKVIELRDRAPFNGVGYLNAEKVDLMHQTCKTIVIKPVRVDLLDQEIEHNITDPELRSQRKEEAQEIARYFTDRVKTAIKNYPDYPYQLLETPEANSFVVEFALVELNPTKASFNILGTIAAFFFPGGGVLGRPGTGSVAFEAQIREGGSNEILIEFRDREADKSSPFSIKDFEEYGHIRRSIDEWAEQYAELSATSRKHRVADSIPFTLNPI